jgi:hypothetical protein
LSPIKSSAITGIIMPDGTYIRPSPFETHLNVAMMNSVFQPWWRQLLITLRDKRQQIRTPTRRKIRQGGNWRWWR